MIWNFGWRGPVKAADCLAISSGAHIAVRSATMERGTMMARGHSVVPTLAPMLKASELGRNGMMLEVSMFPC